jgi:DNA replication protein DnaC
VIGAASGEPVLGRESELGLLKEFLNSDERALVLTGEPGIGKTTLWEAGLELAAKAPQLVHKEPHMVNDLGQSGDLRSAYGDAKYEDSSR